MQERFILVRNALVFAFAGTMDAFTAGVSDNGVCLEDSPTHRCTPAQPSAPRRRLQGAYAYGGFCSAILGVFYSKASAVSMQSAAGPMYRCFFQAPAALSFHGGLLSWSCLALING